MTPAAAGIAAWLAPMLPPWFPPGASAQSYTHYSFAVRAIAWGTFATAQLVGALVEEAYFRGHLLPGVIRFGRWAPMIHTLLFALYHFD